MTGPYINDPGYEVPQNTILAVPHSVGDKTFVDEVVQPLHGVAKRDWFNPHAYYCLPLTVGNQYGYVIKSLRDFDIWWEGGDKDALISFVNNDNEAHQTIKTGFGCGIITIQNRFSLKTPPGINIMTIQPPNMFIPGCFALTGVIECDNIRRDFTFNFKVTIPNLKISVRKGDPVGAFIPIPRYFVDKFSLQPVEKFYSTDFIERETAESWRLSVERQGVDREKVHQSGRRYFNGVHTDNTKYPDHQKRVRYISDTENNDSELD
jgi:hypothetical protein